MSETRPLWPKHDDKMRILHVACERCGRVHVHESDGMEPSECMTIDEALAIADGGTDTDPRVAAPVLAREVRRLRAQSGPAADDDELIEWLCELPGAGFGRASVYAASADRGIEVRNASDLTGPLLAELLARVGDLRRLTITGHDFGPGAGAIAITIARVK